MYKRFMYYNRASLIPSRPALFGIHVNLNEHHPVALWFENNGLPAFLFDPEAGTRMIDNITDCQDFSADQLNAMPPFVRNFKCEGKIESGEPYCNVKKYNDDICPDRKHKADWHPGWKYQALIGNVLGLFLMETLVEAAQDLASKAQDPGQLLKELKVLEDSDYDNFFKAELPDSLFGFNDVQFGDMDRLFAELNRSIFYRSPAICHTALLPAETRYLGHLTESEKTGLLDYDKGFDRDEVDANPPAEKDKSPMKLVFDKGFRQTCPVPLTIDFKDYFYTSHMDGWTTLTIPNDAEAKAYRYDSSKIHGVLLVCLGYCDWGRCREGEIKWSDAAQGNATFEVNGDPVTALFKFDHCVLLEGQRGLRWTPNSEGKFVVRAKVNVEKTFLRVSAVVLL